MTRAHRARQLANALNGETLLGLALARAGGARTWSGPRGLLLATPYRLPLPAAPAFTVGNVVVVREPSLLVRRPRLLAHEERHASQYALCGGPALIPAYLLACAWSWLRCGDLYARNPFERRAGLADGGYADVAPHRARRLGRGSRADGAG